MPGSSTVPSPNLPPTQSHKAVKGVASPWRISKALLHTIYRCLLQGVKPTLPDTQKQTQGSCQIKETKKYGPNERTEQNSRKKTKPNRDSHLSDAEFKTLVIRMLREIIGYGKIIREDVKTLLRDIKKNPQGTNSEGKEAGFKSMICKIRKK